MANQVRPSMQLDNALNILACLDRFSLDSVGFTCPTLKGIVNEHFLEEPLRVFESVTVEGHEKGLTATLVPESPLGKAMTIHVADEYAVVDSDEDEGEDSDDYDVEDSDDDEDEDKDEKLLRQAVPRRAKSFVKFFKVHEYDGWQNVLHALRKHLPAARLQRLMIVDYVAKPRFGGVMRPSRSKSERCIIKDARGVESLLMQTEREDVVAMSLQWLKKHGIRRLAVDDPYGLVYENAVRAFCIGGPENADKAAPNRFMYLRAAKLSFEFLQQLAQECLAADAASVPIVTFYRYEEFVPPLPEHLAQERHKKYGRRCLHFRFDAAGGPYEIVAQNRDDQQWKVTLRGGHSAVSDCVKMFRCENWYRELEEDL